MRIARHTTRLAVSAAVLASALSLTACENGTKDTGSLAPTAHSVSETGGRRTSPSADADGRAQDGDSSKAASGATGGGPRGTNGSGQAAGDGSGSHSVAVPCNGARVKVTAVMVNRPVNHMLLTATNTGSAPCHAYHGPYLRWDAGQAATAFLKTSKPQAVITLAPGRSAYAGVMYRSADGSGSGGHTARTLDVVFANRAGNGSTGPSVRFSLLKGGVTVDSSAWVTYWQSSAEDALTW
ncbi:DUF4232 domain-containing protein [Streptomyces lydicus]|uniref:DUF4232 domain-containing protein n=1 Tax=Streptomyces lydicus TaxID=47763 RepID=UPI003793B675